MHLIKEGLNKLVLEALPKVDPNCVSPGIRIPTEGRYPPLINQGFVNAGSTLLKQKQETRAMYGPAHPSPKGLFLPLRLVLVAFWWCNDRECTGRTPLFSKFRAGIPMICTDPPSNDCFAVLKLDPANVKRVPKLSFFSQIGGQQHVFAHIPCLCQAGNIGSRWLRTWRTHSDWFG